MNIVSAVFLFQEKYCLALIFLSQYAILFTYSEYYILTFYIENQEVTYYFEQKNLSFMRVSKKRHILWT